MDLYKCGHCENVLLLEDVTQHYCFNPENAASVGVVMDDNNFIYLENNARNENIQDASETIEVNATEEQVEEQEQVEKTEWSHAAILFLIEQYREYKDNLQKKNSVKRHIWLKISKNMQQSYKYSVDHIQNKWKSLLRTYKSIKDHHSSTGTNRKNWQYFDLMNELMHSNPAIIPPVIVNNGIIEKTTSAEETNQPDQSDTEPERGSSGQSSPIPLPPKRKCTDNVTALLKTVVAQSQRQHEEEMKEKVKFNNLLEKLVNHMTTEK